MTFLCNLVVKKTIDYSSHHPFSNNILNFNSIQFSKTNMNRNPIFQVRKRKWKTVLVLLRKRKRRILINPSSFNDDGAKQQLKFVEYGDDGFYDSFDGDFDDEENHRNDDNVENQEENGIGDLGLDDEEEDVGDGEKEEVDIAKSAAIVVSKDREKDGGETPPDDDCCPICFENFNIASKTNCGHWFCANCILQYWTYRTVLQKCTCPICARPISKLTPEASLLIMQEAEVVEVLKNVQRYNHLFQGGINGVIRKVFEVPNVFKRMLCGLMDPDRFRGNYYAMRSFALMMSCIYNVSSFDFIPTGTLGVRRLFDLCAIALVVILCLVGICHRLVLRRRVRILAANQF